jgi:hypothetical protein
LLEQKIDVLKREFAEEDQLQVEKWQKLDEGKGQLEKAVDFANHKIVNYYNSTSLKTTRLFRRIIKKIRGKGV